MVSLWFLHRRSRKENQVKLEQYYNEQIAYRQSIMSMNQAKNSLLSLPANTVSQGYSSKNRTTDADDRLSTPTSRGNRCWAKRPSPTLPKTTCCRQTSGGTRLQLGQRRILKCCWSPSSPSITADDPRRDDSRSHMHLRTFDDIYAFLYRYATFRMRIDPLKCNIT